MRRSRGRFFSLLAMLSLFVFLATVGLWVRGVFVTDYWCRSRTDKRGWYSAESRVYLLPGKVRFEAFRVYVPEVGFGPDDESFHHFRLRGGPSGFVAGSSRLHGFAEWEWGTWREVFRPPASIRTALSVLGRRFTGELRILVIPLYPAVLLSAVLPVSWVVGRIRNLRRHQEGHCVICGYDLRATPGRCPECGRVVGMMPAQ
jgi:hypothetical protein